MSQARVLLIETTGPQSGPGCGAFLADGIVLAGSGAAVRVLLVSGGVTAAVPGAVPQLDALVQAGAAVAVDEFSMARRGLSEVALTPGVGRSSLESVAADVLDPDVKVVWH